MYYINIGNYLGHTTRCLSASTLPLASGGNVVESETLPWAGTTDNPWDWKYENGTFTRNPVTIPDVVIGDINIPAL